VKHGRSNNGRRGTDGGGKGRRSASAPREVPSNFPAVVAPVFTASSRLITSRRELAEYVGRVAADRELLLCRRTVRVRRQRASLRSRLHCRSPVRRYALLAQGQRLGGFMNKTAIQ